MGYRRRLAVVSLVLIAAAVMLASCGSSSSSSASSASPSSASGGSTGSATAAADSTGSGGTAAAGTALNQYGAGIDIPTDLPASGLARANAGFTQFTKHPTQIPVTQPVGKPIPSGKTIAFLNCGLPYCKNLYNGTATAGKILGWKVVSYQAGVTPATITKAWTQVVSQRPDAVVATGYPRQLFATQLAQLQQDNIPVVECCITEKPGNGVLDILNNGPQGAEMAWALVHDSGGKPRNVLFVDNKDYPIIDQIFLPEFQSELKKTCPACTMSTIDLPTTSYGTTAPNTIVSYLRAHPNVNYLALGNDGAAIGLPAALNGAGLHVPWVGDNPDIVNQQYISQGAEYAGIAFPGQETMAQLVDVLARHFAGVSISADDQTPETWILYKGNLTSTSTYPVIYTNYLAQYAKLWGK